LKNAHLSSNGCNFWMQRIIAMKYAGYVAWILLFEYCDFDGKIYYNSRDIEFFLGDYYLFFWRAQRPVYTIDNYNASETENVQYVSSVCVAATRGTSPETGALTLISAWMSLKAGWSLSATSCSSTASLDVTTAPACTNRWQHTDKNRNSHAITWWPGCVSFLTEMGHFVHTLNADLEGYD